MLTEFRDFVARGNVLDLAVAVIIGAAFATITSSMTEDLIMPVVGTLFGGLDFSSYFILLGPVPEGYAGSMSNYEALKAAGAPVLGYGQFLTVLLNFLILAFIGVKLVLEALHLYHWADWAPFGGEIFELYVDTGYQGLGFGKELFREAYKELKRDGRRSLLVWALAENEMACRFYNHLGGRQCGSSPERYGDTTLHRVAFLWEPVSRHAR